MSIIKKTDGFLLVNKPSGPTSHDVIDQLRRITGVRQIGHAGTLDPFASGLLLVGVGEATKLLRHYVGLDKEYVATLGLGAVSDTYDRTGRITEIPNPKSQIPNNFQISKSKIQEILKSFLGKQKQVPPMYSAKKVGGQKLYKLARAGKEIKRNPVDIEIYNLRLISLKLPPRQSLPHRQAGAEEADSQILDTITIFCKVSSGTYIRTLAHDIGQKLGTGAYLEELARTAIGNFNLKDVATIPSPSLKKWSEPPLYPLPGHTAGHAPRRMPGRLGKEGKGAPPPSARRGQGGGSWQKHLIPVKTVLVSGTFDGTHEGHRDYFRQARQFGQKLIAIVARDLVSKKFKGRLPRYSEKERIKMVKQCPEIDQVFLGAPDSSPPCQPVRRSGGRGESEGSERGATGLKTVYDFVASLKPDVIALGYDQTAYTQNLAEEMRKRGLKVKIVRLQPHIPEKYKSSLINTQSVDKKQKSS